MSFATVAPNSGNTDPLPVTQALRTGSTSVTDGTNTVNIGYGIFVTRMDNTAAGDSGLINMHVTLTVQADSPQFVLNDGYLGSLFDLSGFNPDPDAGNINWISTQIWKIPMATIGNTYAGSVDILLGEVYLSFPTLPGLSSTSFSFSFIYKDA